jgi:hypothetical protein
MKSRTTRSFRVLLAALPEHVRKQAREAYRLFVLNPAHPSLHFKLVHAKPPTYSVRIGLAYRAVGVLADDTIIWYWVGSHADYDLLLKQL